MDNVANQISSLIKLQQAFHYVAIYIFRYAIKIRIEP